MSLALQEMFYRIVFCNKSKGFKKKIQVTVSLESVGLGSAISMDPINTRGRSRRLIEESLARGYCWVLVRTRGEEVFWSMIIKLKIGKTMNLGNLKSKSIS